MRLPDGVIAKLCPHLVPDGAMAWNAALADAADEFGIVDPTAQAMWLGNIMVETGGLLKFREDMRYSAKRMAEVWPQRFAINGHAALGPTPETIEVAKQGEQAIANYVYGDRKDLGNGPAYTGDGWAFVGRYTCHLTGRFNYQRCNAEIGIPNLLDTDALISDIPGMARVGGWFWRNKAMNTLAQDGLLEPVVKRWVGGWTDSLPKRQARYRDALIALGAA